MNPVKRGRPPGTRSSQLCSPRAAPSSKRRLRPARGVAALVAALMAGGAGLGALTNAAQAVPNLTDPAGTIKTMGGATVNFAQGGYGPEGVLASQSQFSNPRGLNFD